MGVSLVSDQLPYTIIFNLGCPQPGVSTWVEAGEMMEMANAQVIWELSQ